jgi:hypothetical protein
LLILGDYDVGNVGRGRLQKFTPSDHNLMSMIAHYLNKIITTPNIMTEVDNLARQASPDKHRLVNAMRGRFGKIEIYLTSDTAISLKIYESVGLTDTHILAMASDNHLIITDDLPLYHWLSSLQRDAININHIRTFI